MSIGKTTIAVDLMGGENAPYKNLKGVTKSWTNKIKWTYQGVVGAISEWDMNNMIKTK